ncbi:hypothetical protein ABKA04_005455 [Annulohypoxylon sp. FPYF3050]
MLSLAIVGAVTGVVAHHGIFIEGEWHMRVLQVIAGHMMLIGAVFYSLLNHYGSLSIATSSTATTCSAYFFSLFTSPKLAAVTKLWHVYHTLDSRNYKFLQKMYMKYGPFVRTGPNEISIFHPAAIQELDTGKNQTTKDVWYDVLKPHESAVFTRNVDYHKEWRKSWSLSLSTKCMDEYRPRISKLAQLLSQSVAEYGGAPVDIDEVMSWFSFDAMGEVLFGEDFGLTRSKSMHPGIVHRDQALALLGPLEGAIWIARLGFSLSPFIGMVKHWYKMVAFCDEQKKKRIQRTSSSSKLDMASFFLEEYDKNSEHLDAKSRDFLLTGTIISAVVAGSDTTRASLIAACWYLSKYPIHADKIRSELQTVKPDDLDAILALPHLNGVVNEVLRLVPPAMSGNSRITGPDGLMLNGTFIPPFTKVTAPKYVIMRMDDAFAFPDDFIPERWYSRPELIRDGRAFTPFGFGTLSPILAVRS